MYTVDFYPDNTKQILKDGRHDILFWTLSKGIPTRDEFTVCVGRSAL